MKETTWHMKQGGAQTLFHAIDKWLQNFAYRTPVNFGVFALAIFIVFSIALLTVTFVVLKAARTNPAECLRSE